MIAQPTNDCPSVDLSCCGTNGVSHPGLTMVLDTSGSALAAQEEPDAMEGLILRRLEALLGNNSTMMP